MGTELKSCPLCGSQAEVKNVEHSEQVYCSNCDARTLWSPQAREYWNKRSRAIALMPCPICGGAGRVYESYDSTYYVQCRKCGFTTGDTPNSQAAQAAWNRRPINE